MGIVFDNCCFCVDLRIGSLIIGYIALVGSLLTTSLSIVGVIASTYTMTHGKNELTQMRGFLALLVMSVILVLAIFYTVFDILLLVGLHKHKRDYVKAYVVFSTVIIVLSGLGIIVGIVHGRPIGIIIKSILTILISTYFLLVIRSYYLKMDEPDKKPNVPNDIYKQSIVYNKQGEIAVVQNEPEKKPIVHNIV